MMAARVICLGEILWDCLANQPGVPVEQVQSWTAYPGGAPANVATALVKLGTAAAFVGCIGQDEAGDGLLQLLLDCHVETTGVQRHATAPTRQVLVTRSLDGDRTFAGFKNHATTEFADTYLQADQLPLPLFETAEMLAIGTLGLAYPSSRAAIEQALALADRYHLKVLMDVNWRPVFWPDPTIAPNVIRPLLNHVDFLKVTVEEADWLFNTREPAVITHQLDHLEGLLVTDGDRGCWYSIVGHQGHIPAFTVKVVDTTGAGDGFVAGFLHQLCHRGLSCLRDATTVHHIVRYASAVGALTTTRAGAIAAQPTAAEVDAFLATAPSDPIT
ncbi:MAG: carbohydrate kinase [Cyanobacteria bacterium]|nr:carbohydrate kinase [Cyanobacteriota bacterium]MDW8200242.1 carbohydrate kinase [Cyanobacteriota bacterium SKYGB_h_bin112]